MWKESQGRMLQAEEKWRQRSWTTFGGSLCDLRELGRRCRSLRRRRVEIEIGIGIGIVFAAGEHEETEGEILIFGRARAIRTLRVLHESSC
ncbi:hypothetical protein LINGRAHAP2_LOCUS10099 [Linum grandiflorum]